MTRLEILSITTPERKQDFAKILGEEKWNRPDYVRCKDGDHIFDFTFAFSIEEAVSQSRAKAWDAAVLDCDCGLNYLRFINIISSVPFHQRHLSCPKVLCFFLAESVTSDTLLNLGKLNIGDVFISGGNDFYRRLRKVALPEKKGKTALCCAGGGIEGLIYEIGSLRALDESLVGSSIIDFDLFYGISAGAIMASSLANGIPPIELARAFMQDSTILSSISPGKLFDPAFSEFARALIHSFSATAFTSESLVHKLFRAVPNAFFKGDIIEKVIEKTFSLPGMTNSFKELGHSLFIGATDQDTYEHIVFGTEGWDDVPVSRAIHASMSLIPFYTPQYINGRWFIDGSYTRTSEIELAIEHGATLIIVTDPLVPVRSAQSGFVKSKGGVFASIQGLKALINTRFMGMLPHLADQHPEVDIIVFIPKENDMKIMSGSPLKLNFQVEIERISYEETRTRMQEESQRITRAFERHGFELQGLRNENV